MREEQYGDGAMMHIGAKARVIFKNNSADGSGGAVGISNGMITVGAESSVILILHTIMPQLVEQFCLIVQH